MSEQPRPSKIAKELTEMSLLPADYAKRNPTIGKPFLFLVAVNQYLMSIGNENTRVRYKIITEHFTRFMVNTRGLTPLDAHGIDVLLWREDLLLTGGVAGSRENADISRCASQAKSSIEHKTAILSAFFQFLMKPGLDGSDPLIKQNPVEALPHRFTVEKYASSKKIDEGTLRKIMDEIDITKPQGLRNYTLLFGYFLTGRRNTEWVTLQWGNINLNKNPPTYSFIRKGKKETVDEMPKEVLELLLVYLKDRWGTDFAKKITPDTYLFTAMPGRGGPRQKEDANAPLTERFVLKLVKKLAKKAGLDASKITVHSLRHLHADRYLKSGASVEEVRARLGHESLATTQRYVSSMDNQANRLADKLSQILGNMPTFIMDSFNKKFNEAAGLTGAPEKIVSEEEDVSEDEEDDEEEDEGELDEINEIEEEEIEEENDDSLEW